MRTDEELLGELENLLGVGEDITRRKKMRKISPPSALMATIKIWGIPILVVALLLGALAFSGIKVNEKVTTPEYQQHVEFKQFLETIKDQPFTITIDGKKHAVTIGELKNGI